MSLFGSGLSAAVALRARILDRIGAEDEWTATSEELSLIAWMSGPVATFFSVAHGADDTPDLGILRIVTPVAAIGDLEAARWHCDRLNRTATTSRWTITVNSLGAEILAYEVVIPPIPAVWPGSFVIEETLSWLGRHVIERVRAATTW